jgi:hypothetical protein
MGVNLERWPVWSEKALQGLAFWMGHRHSMYRHYPLGEAALVAETCNLIFANLEPGETLLCECQYSKLMPQGTWPDTLGARSRADLVVVRGLTPGQADQQQSLVGHMFAVIEVKRAFARKRDLRTALTIWKIGPLGSSSDAEDSTTWIHTKGKIRSPRGRIRRRGHRCQIYQSGGGGRLERLGTPTAMRDRDTSNSVETASCYSRFLSVPSCFPCQPE